MFYAFSWQGYWTALAIILAVYYVCILLLFYKADMLLLFKGKQPVRPFHLLPETEKTKQAELFSPGGFAPEESDGPEYNPAVTSLVDELQAFFEEAKEKDYTKATLISTLKKLIQKYPGVKNTGYQSSINSLIIFLSEQSCSIHLSAEVVGGLWFDKG